LPYVDYGSRDTLGLSIQPANGNIRPNIQLENHIGSQVTSKSNTVGMNRLTASLFPQVS
jgi:hypothetical protein